MYPQPGNPPQGWGFGGFLTIEPGPSGRGANTMWWMGLANCFWWIDRQKGVAGILGAQVCPRNYKCIKIVYKINLVQVLPNGDPQVIPAWFMTEKTIYDNLQ
jgi:CubicO group peptidase (beta-lactamase class C family)